VHIPAIITAIIVRSSGTDGAAAWEFSGDIQKVAEGAVMYEPFSAQNSENYREFTRIFDNLRASTLAACCGLRSRQQDIRE
jgi:hypothetical protein